MADISTVPGIHHDRLSRLADFLVIAIAVSLPWSTSATSILAVLWLVALVPSIDWRDLRRNLATPAGALPVLLAALGAAGMLWGDVSLSERWNGIDSFLKLLALPLLLTQFRRSGRGEDVFGAYLVSCVVLLFVPPFVQVFHPFSLTLHPPPNEVLVKNAATQSGEFVTCIFGLLFLASDAAERQNLAAIICFCTDHARDARQYALCGDWQNRVGHHSGIARSIRGKETQRQNYQHSFFRRSLGRSRRLVLVALLAWPHRRRFP